MNARWKIIGLAVVVGLSVIAIQRSRNQRPALPDPAPQPTRSFAPTLVVTELPPQNNPAPQPIPELKRITKARTQNSPIAQNNQVTPGKEPLHDPSARDALALVGVDPDADEYWFNSIFDTSLPDNERADLMEDLNETGFDDPKNLTADDLPLILNRLEIIGAVLPDADDFMAEHLLEAQKDLANMFAQATGQQ
jgi:hypothetical protein